jgi:hypothetical protein
VKKEAGLMSNTEQLKKFINNAEALWLDVIYSRREGKQIIINDLDYQAVADPKFKTREKISKYFNEYWGHHLSNTMMCNLKIVTVNDKLYVPIGDPPFMPCEAVSLKVTESGEDQIKLRVVLFGSPDGNKTVYYKLYKSPSAGKFKIISRTGTKNDIRYQPCKGW